MRSDVASLVVVLGRNTGLCRFREECASWRLFSSCLIGSKLVDVTNEVLGSSGSCVFLETTALFNLRLFLKL